MDSLPEPPWVIKLRSGAAWFAERSRRSAAYLPSLQRKPSLGWHILKSATVVHAVAFASVLLLLFVAPPVTRGLAGIVHPKPKKTLGIIQLQNEKAAALSDSMMTFLWTSSGLLWLVLLWLHIPSAMADAAKRSGRSERRADAMRDSAPHQSLLLYRSALALAADPRDEDDLTEKIRRTESVSVQLGHTAIAADMDVRESLWRRAKLRVASAFRSEPEYSVGTSGRYQLDRPLGQGGMGTVYIGVDTKLGRKVAIKGLPEGPEQSADFKSRFHQEAKALAALSHPGIVQVYDLVAEHGRVWIVLEYVEGGDLAAYLRTSGPLPVSESARIGQLCAEALHHAHLRGVVHRDFKPANVLLGAGGQPKISDFGLARLLGAVALTQSGTILGSAPYMSPEQAQGQPAETSADVYSLAVTLFEMLTGTTPFTGDPGSILAQHITQPPPRLSDKRPDMPQELSELIDRMLIKNPAARLSDLREVSTVLQKLGSDSLTPVSKVCKVTTGV